MVRLLPKFGMGQVYLDANREALRMGDRRVGTDHLVLALLADPDSVPARALGCDLNAAREALRQLDRRALLSAGVDTEFDGPVFPGREGDRLPLTPAAKAVFTGLRKEAGGERIGIQHVLLSLLARRRPDPAAALFDALGLDRAAVRDRLRNP
jgi:ATP-dependent Clp protease ATP-binding subunit ClpA